MANNGPNAAPDFFNLDPHRLDEEWVEQPRHYHRHAEQLAQAEKDFEYDKTQLKLTEAEVELAVRKRPEKYGLAEKTTEAVIKAAVATHSRVRLAHQAVLESGHRVDLLKAAVRTLEHRKAALENLVQLHLAGYYSAPRAKGPAGDQMKERQADRAFGSKKKRRAE